MKPISFLVAAMLALAGCGEEKVADVPPTTDPNKRVKMDTVGLTAKSGFVALGADSKIHWLKALASGTDLYPASAFPARVSRLKPERRCDFPAPAEGSIVSVVNLSGSKTSTSIFPTTKELLATNTERLLNPIDAGQNARGRR